jgi:hypothetical protein
LPNGRPDLAAFDGLNRLKGARGGNVMTAFINVEEFAGAKPVQDNKAEVSSFAVDETYWGYVVRGTENEPLRVQIAQGMAWFTGICFAIATLGMWAIPLTRFQGDVLPMKLGATILLAGIATYLLWFASRGTRSELHFDTRLGEVREIVRNQAGRPTLVGRYGFDAIGGVHIDRSATHHGQACLVLRQGNTSQFVPVAWGKESQLLGLRDRLGHDLMVRPLNPLRQAHVMPEAMARLA